jgi:hypothetical protein
LISCNYCGAKGRHMTSECPDLAGGGKPAWCGSCDPRTRLVDHGDYGARCVHCHPSGHKMLPQHTRCGGCGEVVYVFDAAPCGKHQPLAIDSHGHRLPVTIHRRGEARPVPEEATP